MHEELKRKLRVGELPFSFSISVIFVLGGIVLILIGFAIEGLEIKFLTSLIVILGSIFALLAIVFFIVAVIQTTLRLLSKSKYKK